MTGRVVVQFRGVDGTLRRFIFDPVEDVNFETSPGGTNSQPGP